MKSTFDRLDKAIITRVKRLPAGLKPLMVSASLVGQPVVMGAVIAVVAFVARRYDVPHIVPAALYAIIGILVSNVLKLILRRSRPDTYIPFLRHSYSFPSGHAMGSMIVLGLLAWLSAAHLGVVGAVAALTCLLLIGLIGLSRVYLGAHYPTDVLGGWALGLVAIVIVKWATAV